MGFQDNRVSASWDLARDFEAVRRDGIQRTSVVDGTFEAQRPAASQSGRDAFARVETGALPRFRRIAYPRIM